MGETLTLKAADGHEFSAYRVDPDDVPLAAVVVIQEIFGVNEHIRDICERFAAVGYVAIAPALYDRFERGFEVGYGEDDIARGRELKAKANEEFDAVMTDVDAARAAVADVGNVAVTGFCWGGVVTWAAACRLGFQAASSYYGGGILPMVEETPGCPTILHFGRNDASIPMEEVEQIDKAHPGCPVYVYDAGHGFNCDMRGSFDPGAAQVSAMRTIRLFDANLSGV